MDLTLTTKQHLVDNIWSFRFTASGPVTWTAGQHMDVAVPHDRPDDAGISRTFTIASAPYEGILQITTRISDSSFKQALAQLETGDVIQMVKKPSGDFIWQDTSLPKIFIAGGIGITAFHAILAQRVHEGLPLSVTLLYGNRTEAIPFQEELDSWRQKDDTFHVEYVVGKPLAFDSIVTMVPGINDSLVYLSGPEPMVQALSSDLTTHGLPSAQLKLDGFTRYTQENY